MIAPFTAILARNHIRYHQRSLLVQEFMFNGEHEQALRQLAKLERRYGLMPTETFARAMCQLALKDTAAARQSYVLSIAQGASLGWLYFSKPMLSSRNDSLWYQRVITACEAEWSRLPHYVDGPNEGLPTPTSALNRRHQFLLDSIGEMDREDEKRLYEHMIALHDRMLDSMLKGLIAVPSIARYGMNSEFETFLLHTSASHKVSAHRKIKQWLKDGLIYPRTYAICFDDLALEENRPFPFGFFMGLKPGDLAPGHQRRRATIGMGDEAQERRRFHFSE
ncbi:MAG: hypothetical protein JNM91_11530 [Flavobacteriales bacterium]|nr:hypothetical protein [Flavobacteriales bacterium]